MAQTNIMTWNLGKYGPNEHLATQVQYVQFVASVMQYTGTNLIGFCGIYAGLAEAFSTALINELDNRDRQPDKWRAQASPQLGLGRNEQYCFVWNSEKFLPSKTSLTDYFQYDFPLPFDSKNIFGFPRVHTKSQDMPPYLGYFQLLDAATTKYLAVVLFHAPAWDGDSGRTIGLACDTIPLVPAFQQGDGLLLMGTFNVPIDDNVDTPNSNGAWAFNNLAGPKGPYQQLTQNVPNRLATNASVAMSMEEALVQTADNLFFRKTSELKGFSCTNMGVANIFDHVFNTYNTSTDKWMTAPLGPPLANLERLIADADDVLALPDGSYAKLEDAFRAYRGLVSAYLPIGFTLTY
ncbi:hypothetical protein [Hymenobacter negativus]|uniref:Endonuclease/exonuclease/phosphatase domain-containing protein n=1 Tax=Hymenobacter negativus TaxID=2795026 RepID=A0ABS3QL78_9BACT|nr:hypothetical protein [Hymenobacter negativus]MBO2011917.1 hypothetical protein [Hymenobacter negativus]